MIFGGRLAVADSNATTPDCRSDLIKAANHPFLPPRAPAGSNCARSRAPLPLAASGLVVMRPNRFIIEHRPFFPSPCSCREWFVHPLKKGAQHYRLLPKERDHDTYLAIVNGDGTLLRASANYEVIRGEKPDVSTNVTEALRKLNVLESSTICSLGSSSYAMGVRSTRRRWRGRSTCSAASSAGRPRLPASAPPS